MGEPDAKKSRLSEVDYVFGNCPDLILLIDGKKFKVDMKALKCNSEYFRALTSANFCEHEKPEIELKAIKMTKAVQFFEVFFSQKMTDDPSTQELCSLLEMCGYFQANLFVARLFKDNMDFFVNNMTLRGVLDSASNFGLVEIKTIIEEKLLVDCEEAIEKIQIKDPTHFMEEYFKLVVEFNLHKLKILLEGYLSARFPLELNKNKKMLTKAATTTIPPFLTQYLELSHNFGIESLKKEVDKKLAELYSQKANNSHVEDKYLTVMDNFNLYGLKNAIEKVASAKFEKSRNNYNQILRKYVLPLKNEQFTELTNSIEQFMIEEFTNKPKNVSLFIAVILNESIYHMARLKKTVEDFLMDDFLTTDGIIASIFILIKKVHNGIKEPYELLERRDKDSSVERLAELIKIICERSSSQLKESMNKLIFSHWKSVIVDETISNYDIILVDFWKFSHHSTDFKATLDSFMTKKCESDKMRTPKINWIGRTFNLESLLATITRHFGNGGI